jgi:hypothetical protein
VLVKLGTDVDCGGLDGLEEHFYRERQEKDEL